MSGNEEDVTGTSEGELFIEINKLENELQKTVHELEDTKKRLKQVQYIIHINIKCFIINSLSLYILQWFIILCLKPLFCVSGREIQRRITT